MNEKNDRRPKILVIDDDEGMLEVLELRLESWGYTVFTAETAGDGESRAVHDPPDLILSDVVLPDKSGLELLRSLKGENQDLPVILMTAHGTVDMAVEAMKRGAQDFITKPIDYGKLRSLLESAEKDRQLLCQTEALGSRIQEEASFGEFVGASSAMREVYDLIRWVADSEAPVLISGESGTGKELAARTIHSLSRRRSGPFFALNTAAVPAELMESEVFGHEKGAFTGAVDVRPGCFEVADGGTLFLDEIGEMPLNLQPKLLRVLEDGRVRRLGGKKEFTCDVRLLAATNRDPQEVVSEGRLREDLYYRINVCNVHLPPLRQRKGDVSLLVEHFRERLNRKHQTSVKGVRKEVEDLLQKYHWPGNVRELRNVVERSIILARQGWIEVNHLPPFLRREDQADPTPGIVFPEGVTVAEAEKALILKTLERTGYNKAETARQLGLDVKTIRNKLKSYGLTG